jgi:hypothetical protein
VFGTPGYMSPEQAEGKPAGPASDVFALGCVIAYAATGAGPFGSGTAAAVLYRVVHAEPALDRVPPALRGIISACLAKDPAARPALRRWPPRSPAEPCDRAVRGGLLAAAGGQRHRRLPGPAGAGDQGDRPARAPRSSRILGHGGASADRSSPGQQPVRSSRPVGPLGGRYAAVSAPASWLPRGYSPPHSYPSRRDTAVRRDRRRRRAGTACRERRSPGALTRGYLPADGGARRGGRRGTASAGIAGGDSAAGQHGQRGQADVRGGRLCADLRDRRHDIVASVLSKHPVPRRPPPWAAWRRWSVLLSLIEIALWLWIARACRNGRKLGPVTGTVLFGTAHAQLPGRAGQHSIQASA